MQHFLVSALPDAVVGVVFAVGIAPEPLPGEPSHGRRPGESVVQSRARAHQQHHQQQRNAPAVPHDRDDFKVCFVRKKRYKKKEVETKQNTGQLQNTLVDDNNAG